MTNIVLWDYPKSSASYRVRIALNLTGEEYDIKTVNLLENAHRGANHLARNPQGLVPVLDIDGQRLTQSLAILDYLNQTRNLRLLPEDPVLRAKVTAASHALAVDVHPVCNLSVMVHATGGQDPARTDWMQHFIRPGLQAFETLISAFGQTTFACGDAPSLADICLIPQLYNAHRWGVDYSSCPRISAVEKACISHPAFKAAHPNS